MMTYGENSADFSELEVDASLQTGLQPMMVIGTAVLGFMVLIISLGIGFIVIARKKPKEILTLME